MTVPGSRTACRTAAVCAAAFLLVVAAPGPALHAQQPAPPELTEPVNDFANVISEAQEAELDRLSRTLQSASGDVLVVATVKTFQPYGDLKSYAVEMFQNHGKGVGQKGRDNGLLLVLSLDDRQVWTEVGYDLEGIITDGYAGQTSRETMVPSFRNGDYGGGLVAGATRFAQRIAQARGVTLDGVRSAPVSGSDRERRNPDRPRHLSDNHLHQHRARRPACDGPGSRTPRTPVDERRRAVRSGLRRMVRWERRLGRRWRIRWRLRRIRRRPIRRRRRRRELVSLGQEGQDRGGIGKRGRLKGSAARVPCPVLPSCPSCDPAQEIMETI